MPENVDTPSGTGLERATLSDSEESRLKLAFRRAFDDVRFDGNTSVLMEKMWNQYRNELIFAAEVAKAQFDGINFDGVDPDTNAFGVDSVFAGYFGFNTWDEFTDYTQAEVVDWIDASAPNIGGSSGRDSPVQIGEDVVHVILGVGSYDPSPVTSRVQFVVNDQPGTAVATREAFTKTDSRIKWFESPKVLHKDTDVYARAYGEQEGTDALYPVGATFIKEKIKRALNPSDFVGEEVIQES